MTWQDVAAGVLLAVTVAAAAFSVAGVLAMPTAYARLHFLAPASALGSVALALAVLVKEAPASPASIKSILVALVLLASGPVLTHATARAARIREHGDLRARPGEQRR